MKNIKYPLGLLKLELLHLQIRLKEKITKGEKSLVNGIIQELQNAIKQLNIIEKEEQTI